MWKIVDPIINKVSWLQKVVFCHLSSDPNIKELFTTLPNVTNLPEYFFYPYSGLISRSAHINYQYEFQTSQIFHFLQGKYFQLRSKYTKKCQYKC